MPNIWRQFTDLLPNTPRLIGNIDVDHGDGAVTVTLLDGGTLRAKVANESNVPLGQRVFVRDGRIEGQAPDLPQVDIEI